MPLVHLDVHIRPGSDALHRVVCVCHRRGVAIGSLRYRESVISLAAYGDPRQTGHIGVWLEGLPDVLGVFEVDAAAGGGPGSGRTGAASRG
jgi:hypothetical protein